MRCSAYEGASWLQSLRPLRRVAELGSFGSTMKPTEEYITNMTILQNLKTARRSSKDRWIGGVCGGLGAATQIPSWVWRAVLLFSLLAFGAGLLFYVVLWICIPIDRT